MKYLKSYNETFSFSSVELSKDIIQNISDICIELVDIGFCEIETDTLEISCPYVCIQKEHSFTDNGEDSFFEYEKVEEVVERIKDYMSGCGYNTQISKLKGPYNPNVDHNRLIFKVLVQFS